ncbi:hypothetical protein D9M71_644250 [compost metagenome]
MPRRSRAASSFGAAACSAARSLSRTARRTSSSVPGCRLNSVRPSASSMRVMRGSPAISPHTATGTSCSRPVRRMCASRRSTAGCSGEYSSPTASLLRSAASRYWTRSLVPIDRKSTKSMKLSSAIAAAGTSIIAPNGMCSATSWPSARSSSACLFRRRRTASSSSRVLTIGSRMRSLP